jgi:hypothetical protein
MPTITVYRDRQFYVIDNGSRKDFIPEGRIAFRVDTPTTLTAYISPFHKSTIVWVGDAVDILDKDGDPYSTDSLAVINALNIGVDVNLQDQHSEVVDTFFLESISPFTLASDTVASTVSTLEYDFEATAGHGLIVGSELILLDIIADHESYMCVQAVDVNTITVDRPMDSVYPAATTLCQIVNSEMAVDGSATERIFTVRSGVQPTDIVRLVLTILDGSAMDDGKFGGITALTRGFNLRVIDGVQENIFNLKSNGEIKQFCYDVNYSSKAAQGSYGLSARMSFGGQSKHGVTIRLSGSDRLQWIVQDDLTGLTSLRVSAQGHKVV